MDVNEKSSSAAVKDKIMADGVEEVSPALSGPKPLDEEKASGEGDELPSNAQVYLVGWKLHFVTVA